MRISANIGFLWDHLPLPERIEAAAIAGFDAVECHFPYEFDAALIQRVLEEHNLPMVGINTALGPEGCFGLAAVPGEQEAARKLIDQAIEYAAAIDAANINVVAGLTDAGSKAEETYRSNLQYACESAAEHNKRIVIEPLNPRSVENYHFSTVEHAIDSISAVRETAGVDNIFLMFDFFHAQIVQGDIAQLLKDYIDYIGHVQISAIHDRGEPDVGEIYYPYLLKVLEELGYNGFVGAEYKPRGESVEAGLSWLSEFQQSAL